MKNQKGKRSGSRNRIAETKTGKQPKKYSHDWLVNHWGNARGGRTPLHTSEATALASAIACYKSALLLVDAAVMHVKESGMQRTTPYSLDEIRENIKEMNNIIKHGWA